MAPVQRDGMEYEMDVVADMDQENNLIVSKTRCPALNQAVIAKPGEEIANTIKQWLTDGAPAPAPVKQETKAQEPANGSGHQPNKIMWPKQVVDAIVAKGYADNDFNARAMLDRSNLPADVDYKIAVGWARNYRSARDEGKKDVSEAAQLANSAYAEYLKTL